MNKFLDEILASAEVQETLKVELDTCGMANNRLARALQDALCWLDCHASSPDAEALAEKLSKETGVPKGPCWECKG
jgi:hypothetical protein